MDLDLEKASTLPSSDRSVSPLVFLTALLGWRRKIVSLALVGIVGVTAYSILRGERYSSTLTFMPQVAGGSLSGIAGVAAQFGIAVPSGSPDQTPQFYAELMATEPFEQDLVSTRFPAIVGKTADGKRDSTVIQSLIDWMAIDQDRSPSERRSIAAAKLGTVMTVIPDVQTTMVTVNVTTEWPDLSKEVADRALDLINTFNTVRRGGDAGVERRFVEGRLALARDSLAVAEDRIRLFLERNRTYGNSPMLTLDHDRLQREVDFEQQVVATLMQAVEQARITEVRNTPVVSVVEVPSIAAIPDRRRLLLKWTIVVMVAVIVGVVAAVVNVGMKVEEDFEPDASTALRMMWNATLADLLKLWVLWRRLWHHVSRRKEA